MFINQVVNFALSEGTVKNGIIQVKKPDYEVSIRINHKWLELRVKMQNHINLGDDVELFYRVLATDERYDTEATISDIIYDEWDIPFYKVVYQECHYTP